MYIKILKKHTNFRFHIYISEKMKMFNNKQHHNFISFSYIFYIQQHIHISFRITVCIHVQSHIVLVGNIIPFLCSRYTTLHTQT